MSVTTRIINILLRIFTDEFFALKLRDKRSTRYNNIREGKFLGYYKLPFEGYCLRVRPACCPPAQKNMGLFFGRHSGATLTMKFILRLLRLGKNREIAVRARKNRLWSLGVFTSKSAAKALWSLTVQRRTINSGLKRN